MLSQGQLDRHVASCLRALAAGASVEDLVGHLRDQGCSKIEAIRVLTSVTPFGLRELKPIVHFSPVWSDVRERDEQLHQVLEDLTEAENGPSGEGADHQAPEG